MSRMGLWLITSSLVIWLVVNLRSDGQRGDRCIGQRFAARHGSVHATTFVLTGDDAILLLVVDITQPDAREQQILQFAEALYY